MIAQACRGLSGLAVLKVHFSGLAFVAVMFLAVLSARASANVVVNLAGTGAGTVVSSPLGIECSNVGGLSGPSCDSEFANNTPVELSAAPGNGFAFSEWSADDPFGPFVPFFFPGATSCNSGNTNPCLIVNQVGPTVHVTATFVCTPPIAPPFASTGESSIGEDFSALILEGTVDPRGCGLEESYFEYGPTTEYGSITSTVPNAVAIGEGSNPVAVTGETEPLEPNTAYHYRLVASGPGGTSIGEDRTFTTGAAPVGKCPNEAIRHEQGIAALHLPECMALEMVSPSVKAGSSAKYPNVSADGTRVSFLVTAALGEDPPVFLSVGGATYVASLIGSGWTSEMTVPDLTPPLRAQWSPSSEKRPSFTPDFSRWLGIGATAEQIQQQIGWAFEAGLGGFYKPLSESLVPLSFSSGGNQIGVVVRNSVFQGASADHSRFYFKPGGAAIYISGAPSLGGPGAEPANVYLARNGADGQPAALELLSRDRTGKVWGGNCGARLGGIGSVSNSSLPAPNGERNQGAVSANGSRTYLSARVAQSQSGPCDEVNKLRILRRLETPTGPEIFPLFVSECSRPAPGECSNADGNDLFQGASLDGNKVYFTTNRQLASSDLDGSNAECDVLLAVAGCDLYVYDGSRAAGERLIQVSAGEDVPAEHEAGKEADVYNGITAISADGSHVYFVATGMLTDDSNPEGVTAQLGQPNLYMWDAGSEETAFLGTLDTGDAIGFDNKGDGLWGGQGTWRNNAYPVPTTDAEGSGLGGDGHILVFESKAELTANDADGPHLDAYRYDAAGPSLECLSCAPDSSASEPDEAFFDVDDRGEETPPGTDFAESRRWVSEDGEEVGFMTPEALLPGDVDEAKDGYLWRRGALTRLPGKPFGGDEAAAIGDGPFLSHDGSTVAFATSTALLPQDGDSAADIYVAREDGGFLNPPEPNPCEPGNPSKKCQQGEPEPPPPVFTTNSFVGPGNSKPRSCSKGKVRRKGRCVPKHAKKKHRTRQANNNRRTAK